MKAGFTGFVAPLALIVGGLMLLAGCGGSSSSTGTAYFGISGTATINSIDIYDDDVYETSTQNRTNTTLSPDNYDFLVFKNTSGIIAVQPCLTGAFTIQSGKKTNISGFCS